MSRSTDDGHTAHLVPECASNTPIERGQLKAAANNFVSVVPGGDEEGLSVSPRYARAKFAGLVAIFIVGTGYLCAPFLWFLKVQDTSRVFTPKGAEINTEQPYWKINLAGFCLGWTALAIAFVLGFALVDWRTGHQNGEPARTMPAKKSAAGTWSSEETTHNIIARIETLVTATNRPAWLEDLTNMEESQGMRSWPPPSLVERLRTLVASRRKGAQPRRRNCRRNSPYR